MGQVLIADDESIIRMDLKETLEAAGHQVVGEAADGREAVRLAEMLQPDPHSPTASTIWPR